MSSGLVDKLPFLPNGEENNLILNEKNNSNTEWSWSYVLKDRSFVLRFIISIVIILIIDLIILSVTSDSKSTAWYNQIYKPDWMPEAIPFVIITTFFIILLCWVWYRLSCYFKNNLLNSWLTDIMFLIFFGLLLAWGIVFYGQHNISTGRWLICFVVAAAICILVTSFYFLGFSDATMFSLILVLWLILTLFVCFNIHSLDKEYKILGIVRDKNSSLYRKKDKLERLEGIKVTEQGEKIEFNPEEQE